MEYDFDLVTLGAGSGGVAASRRAGSYGARVAICESVRVGGTCVLRGCVPKKLLCYGSHFREDLDDAAGFGWTVGESTLDWGKLIAAKDRELDRLNAIYIRMLRDSGVKLFDGRGTIVDPHTVEIAGQRVTAKHILIATGGWPVMPRVPGIEHAITSNEALDLPELPRRVVIVGGGYIAVEFAGIFHSAGAHVEIVLRADSILRGFDEDIRAHLRAQLARQGIAIRCDSVVRSLEKEANGAISVRLASNELLEADAVLYATGRAPNTRGLGLEEVGVKLNPSGAVAVDEWSCTSVPSIFAVGDVTDRINLTPVAIHEGRAFAETTFNHRPMKIDHHGVPSAVFSQPPVATVGLSEEQARLAHAEVDIYRSSFRPMKSTLSGRDTQTMIKLVVDRATDRVLGAHMVGADAPEIIQGLAIALKCGATKAQFDSTIGLHPTAAEEFVTMRDPVRAPH
ncbi:MAG: glutathione-disulfide reductase [Byssovorax sp.]